MKRFSLYLVCLLFIACQQSPQPEFYIEIPQALSVEHYRSTDFSEAFYSESRYRYAEFVGFDATGKLIYKYPGGLNNNYIDSTKYYHSAELILTTDTILNYFRTCKASIRSDSLQLQFSDQNFSRDAFSLTVLKVQSKLEYQYQQKIKTTDTSYRRPTYTVIEQGLILDQKEYRKADSIKGKIHLTIIGTHTWPSNYQDTTHILGLFKAIVE